MGLLDGLVLYYKCDETSGLRADAHSGGLDMAITGTVGSAAGKIGLGVDGTGSSSNFLDRVSTAALLFGDGPFTISGWQNIGTGEDVQDQPIFTVFNTTGNQRCYQLYWDNSASRYRFVVSGDGTNTDQAVATWGSATALNVFLHAVGIHDPDANEIKLSINNNPFVTAAHSTGSFASSTARPGLGSSGSGTVVGLAVVDEIGVWDRILTDAELANLQAAPPFSTFTSDAGTPAFYNYYWRQTALR